MGERIDEGHTHLEALIDRGGRTRRFAPIAERESTRPRVFFHVGEARATKKRTKKQASAFEKRHQKPFTVAIFRASFMFDSARRSN